MTLGSNVKCWPVLCGSLTPGLLPAATVNQWANWNFIHWRSVLHAGLLTKGSVVFCANWSWAFQAGGFGLTDHVRATLITGLQYLNWVCAANTDITDTFLHSRTTQVRPYLASEMRWGWYGHRPEGKNTKWQPTISPVSPSPLRTLSIKPAFGRTVSQSHYCNWEEHKAQTTTARVSSETVGIDLRWIRSYQM